MAKAYIVKTSVRADIKIDADEVPKILEGIRRGVPIVLRQGILNPSFFAAIVEDTERLENYHHDLSLARHEVENGTRKAPELKMLKDIFEGIKSLAEAKMALKPQARTEVQEEAAREERRLKSGNGTN